MAPAPAWSVLMLKSGSSEMPAIEGAYVASRGSGTEVFWFHLISMPVLKADAMAFFSRTTLPFSPSTPSKASTCTWYPTPSLRKNSRRAASLPPWAGRSICSRRTSWSSASAIVTTRARVVLGITWALKPGRLRSGHLTAIARLPLRACGSCWAIAPCEPPPWVVLGSCNTPAGRHPTRRVRLMKKATFWMFISISYSMTSSRLP
ncbi:hypothetical protein D3C86_1348390 [compost metagenome]